MKRLLLTICILLALTSSVGARMTTMVASGGVPVAATSCTRATIQQQEEATSGIFIYFGDAAGSDWIATELSYSGTTGNLCSIDIPLRISNLSGSGTLGVYIYSGDNTDPNSDGLLGTCSTLDISTLTETVTWYTFTCDVNISNGTIYWIVMDTSAYDGTRYPRWYTDAECATERNVYGGNGTSWTLYSTDKCGAFKLYIKE